ncbi:MAG: amidohydrolase family protein [Oscillospiraceae bacterium]
MVILKNCRLIKELTENYDGEMADILIDGKLIKDIRPANYNFQVDCETIDAQGKTVLPGLLDIHAHFNLLSQNVLEMSVQDPATAAFEGYAYAKEYLKQGYTTVRDCGSSYSVGNAIRNAINKDIIEGPRVISSGRIITPTENGNKCFPLMYVEADGANEVQKVCRKLFQDGADFIKCMATGAFYNDGGVPGQTIVTEDEIKMMVEVAKSKDTYVATHCHGTEAIKLCIKCGVRTIEHCSLIDDEGIEMLKNSTTSFMVPTIAIDKVPYDEPETIPEYMWDKINTLTDISHACIKKAYAAGVMMGWGSDLDMENFVKRPGYEFIARKEMLGFSNLDMLLQSTKYSAIIAKLDDKLGTVKVGKYADLIVVDGNPDEDIYAMTKPLLHILKEGKVIA